MFFWDTVYFSDLHSCQWSPALAPSAADTYDQSTSNTSADCTALSANYIRPSCFLCCGPDGLELTKEQTDVSWSVCRFW